MEQAAARLKDKVAVVTGASRGIGLAIAHALGGEGCALALAARNHSALANATKELSAVPVLANACDVSRESDVTRLVAAVRERFGRVDVLVNNAGVSHALHNVQDLPLSDWQHNLDINLTGIFLCTRAALPLMSRGGAIVNNLSVAARSVFPGEAAYCASKFGALGFTNTLREELRPRGIRVIALIAGATDTAIWNQFMPEAPREKMLRPETVAAAVVNALVLPENVTVEELVLGPTRGAI